MWLSDNGRVIVNHCYYRLSTMKIVSVRSAAAEGRDLVTYYNNPCAGHQGMSRPKRQHITSEPALSKVKRQRVSTACDTCRVARDKCDGEKPTCGPCHGRGHLCSYASRTQKRGMQSGYVQALELSLAWIFENITGSEKAIHGLIVTKGGSALSRKNTALHQKWTTSAANKELKRLLTNGPEARNSSTQDADASSLELSGSESFPYLSASLSEYHLSSHELSVQFSKAPTQQHHQGAGFFERPRLPQNWQHLMFIHASQTHAWLPVTDPGDLLQAARAYDASTAAIEPENAPQYALLWSVLALAAFHDASLKSSSVPRQIFTRARSMMPSETGPFSQSHIPALLFHCLVLIGLKRPFAACLVANTACRIALKLHATGTLDHGSSEPIIRLCSMESRLLAACCMMDTWTSLTLGQPTSLGPDLHDRLAKSVGLNSSWATVDSLTSDSTHCDYTSSDALATFYQLYKFVVLLNESFRSTPASAPSSQSYSSITYDDLLKSLSKQFSYCDCLTRDVSTPAKPSAFLLQIAFLTTTVFLTPRPRPRLFTTILRVTENCLATLGAVGTPPLVSGLLWIVYIKFRSDYAATPERAMWDCMLGRLTKTWNSGLDVVDQCVETPSDGISSLSSDMSERTQQASTRTFGRLYL